MTRVARIFLGGTLVLSFAGPTLAQESKSAAVAKQLSAALDEAKLSSIAVKDASQPDVFIAALYYPGSMLLVVQAKMATGGAALAQKIAKKDFQEAYVDLQSASDHETKFFVQDNGADGLKMKSFDTVDTHDKSVTYDGDWKKAKAASEQAYQKSFDDADAQYTKMLTALIAALKKTS